MASTLGICRGITNIKRMKKKQIQNKKIEGNQCRERFAFPARGTVCLGLKIAFVDLFLSLHTGHEL